VRERFAVPTGELARTLATLTTRPGIAEAVVVSTCNRIEYYAAAHDAEAALCSLQQFVVEQSGMVPLFYSHDSAAAIGHLFRVVSGLDSMVLGETEILGQVKEAYAAAHEAGSTARTLNKFFQRAFNVAKEVRTQTNITRGSVSVGSVAVDLAEKIFGQLGNCRVLILGAGETGEMTARALLSRGVTRLLIANRTPERAAALGGEAIAFEDRERYYPDVDILISSTAAPHQIVTRAQIAPLMAQRSGRPLFLIDLAVPRDIDPAVNQIDGAYLYDIDSLQFIAQRGLERRKREITQCEQLISRHAAEFHQWLNPSQ